MSVAKYFSLRPIQFNYCCLVLSILLLILVESSTGFVFHSKHQSSARMHTSTSLNERSSENKADLPSQHKDNDNSHFGDDAGWTTVNSFGKNSKRKKDRNAEITAATTSTVFVVILIGLPGSGKSTFAKALEQASPHRFVRINQDALGSRAKCENAMRKVLLGGNENGVVKCPIIDRCNFNATQRRHFLDIASQFHVSVDAIFFECSAGECVSRCENRGDTHETIKPGMGRKVVNIMRKQLELPDGEEWKWRRLKKIVNTGDQNGRNNLRSTITEYLAM